MVYDRIICFGPKRLRTRTSFYKPQCPLRIMTSFFSWRKAQRAAIKWYPSTWKAWAALLDCRQGRVTSCSRPALLRSAFLFSSYLFPLAHARGPGAKSCGSPVTSIFKEKHTRMLNEPWNKKMSPTKTTLSFLLWFSLSEPAQLGGGHNHHRILTFLLLSPEIISKVFYIFS